VKSRGSRVATFHVEICAARRRAKDFQPRHAMATAQRISSGRRLTSPRAWWSPDRDSNASFPRYHSSGEARQPGSPSTSHARRRSPRRCGATYVHSSHITGFVHCQSVRRRRDCQVTSGVVARLDSLPSGVLCLAKIMAMGAVTRLDSWSCQCPRGGRQMPVAFDGGLHGKWTGTLSLSDSRIARFALRSS